MIRYSFPKNKKIRNKAGNYLKNQIGGGGREGKNICIFL